jgi:hypothetical protein
MILTDCVSLFATKAILVNPISLVLFGLQQSETFPRFVFPIAKVLGFKRIGYTLASIIAQQSDR